MPIFEVVLADVVGVLAVYSTTATVYYLDADVPALLRVPGASSRTGPSDFRWVPLLEVESATRGGLGVLRVGDRHRWSFAYQDSNHPQAPARGWWLQQTAVRIEPVTDPDLARLPPRIGAW
ncbi:hypothetical protein [Cellulomonas massiliensis]|uniref:hypothetical protein n=1 Tax=Cellulomonas massiliensis TaxID=1465811 RepID=UPI00037401F0|nr:hypothetical protein [Cellulomonas massiliensis]